MRDGTAQNPMPDSAETGDPVTMNISGFRDEACAIVASPDAGQIEKAFFSHNGRIADKWHHYLPLYERYFSAFKRPSRPVRMLEIGVWKGGSMQLWRDFFGPEATIFGVDIDPACAAFDGEGGNRIRIGSQSNPDFLRQVVAEMGGVDIVLDDGSHKAGDQRASFDTLFPLLETGGLYVVEDLHTAYWTSYGGGYESKASFVALCKTLMDDMHHWYHRAGEKISASQGHVAALHMHDSIVFLEKQQVEPPIHSRRGQP